MTRRSLWILLILVEAAYVTLSTWASVTFRHDPWTGEWIRSGGRAVSLAVYVILTRRWSIPPAPKTSGRRIWLWLGLLSILTYPLLLRQSDAAGWVAVFWFVSSFLVGFREEYFYRRLVQNELETRWGRGAAILTTSVFFTAYHVYFFVFGYWMGVAEVFLFALAIGLVYSATRSLVLVALFHGLYDALFVVAPNLIPLPYQWGLVLLALGVAFAFWGTRLPSASSSYRS